MDVSQLDLPPLEECLSRARAAWEKANRIGQTSTTWEQEEKNIRTRYAELASMPEEARDVAVTQGHLEKAGMLNSLLEHIDKVLLPMARAREATVNRKARRSSKKKGRGKTTQKGKRR